MLKILKLISLLSLQIFALSNTSGLMLDVNNSNLKKKNYSSYDAYGMHKLNWNISVDMTKNQKYLVSEDEKKITIWDVNRSLLIRTIDTNTYIRKVVLIDDDKAILTHSLKSISVWNLENGKLIRTLYQDDLDVYLMVLSPDKKWLAFYDENKIIHICNVASGEEIQRFKIDEESLSHIAIDNNAKHLSWSLDDGNKLVLWDIENSKKVNTFHGYSASISSLLFTSNQKYLISLDWDGYIRIWDIKLEKFIKTLSNKEDKFICSIDISRDEKYLLSSAKDIKLWNLETGALVKTFFGSSENEGKAKFINNDQKILSYSHTYDIKIRDIASSKLVKTFSTLKLIPHTVRFSTNKKYLVTSFKRSDRTKVAIWDIKENKLFKILESNSSQEITTLEVSQDNEYLFIAYGNRDGGGKNIHIEMWDIKNNKLLKTFSNGNKNAEDRENIFDIALGINGKYFATYLNSAVMPYKNEIELWSVESGRLINTFFDVGGKSRKSMVISQDSKWLILGNEKGQINFCSIEDKNLSYSVQISNKEINEISLFDIDKLLISSGDTVYLRSLKENKTLKKFKIKNTTIFKIVTSNNPENFILDSMSNGISVWSIHKDKPFYSSSIDYHYSNMGTIVDLSDDGKEVAIGFSDGGVRFSSIADIEKPKKIFIFGNKNNWIVFDEVNKKMNFFDERSFLLKKNQGSQDVNMNVFKFDRIR